MSIIQQHSNATLSDNWRTINIDALTEDSSVNFDTSTLHPPQPEITEADVKGISGQVRQLLRGGDAEGALRGCLETPVYNGSNAAKVRTAPFNELQCRLNENKRWRTKADRKSRSCRRHIYRPSSKCCSRLRRAI